MAQELPIDVERTQKKAFPGGVDEDELQVLSSLPEYALKTDARSMQRQVYKNMYNEELKENRPNEAPEE